MTRLCLWLLFLHLAWANGFFPDRRELAPRRAPYQSLCRIGAGGGVGCGVLIDSDLVLTCAHVVTNQSGQLYPDVKFEFGISLAGAVHTAKLKEAYLPEASSADPGSGFDWALLRLDRPIGLLYGWIPCRATKPENWLLHPVKLLGLCACPDELRPEFGKLDTPYLCDGKILGWTEKVVMHDCSMWAGTSGAPILREEDGQLVVVAVNSAGVNLEGEKFEHGFRRESSRDIGNIAVPARNWMKRLQSLAPAARDLRRSFWVRNRSTSELKISVRYHCLFADPSDSARLLDWVCVPPRSRVLLLSPEHGLSSDEVWLSLRNSKDEVVGPQHKLKFDLKGATDRRFYRHVLLGGSEYTAYLP